MVTQQWFTDTEGETKSRISHGKTSPDNPTPAPLPKPPAIVTVSLPPPGPQSAAIHTKTHFPYFAQQQLIPGTVVLPLLLTPVADVPITDTGPSDPNFHIPIKLTTSEIPPPKPPDRVAIPTPLLMPPPPGPPERVSVPPSSFAPPQLKPSVYP